MCRGCTRKPPLLAIDHPKRHEHSLFYFSIKGSFLCDVCALDHRSLMYSCRNCDFKAHKDCVYLPSIVRISRHQHRLSFTSSLTPEKWFCGVCRGKIDTNYGRYSCVKGCSYGVHSKCATREDVWDGKELEGQTEDPYEDIKSFDEISDGIIQHFSHQNHHMKLDDETNRKFDENKRCQACTLAICDEIIYSCMQCDFILHQDCAQLPLRKQHPTHPHPLSLQVDYQNSWFKCKACYRESNGFKYFCLERKCKYELEVCCASIREPLDHQCHPHPLFFTAKPQTKQICSICQVPQSHQLNCGECGFVLCFRCATLPNKLRYKHDEHFLIFTYDKNASGQYWCDVCEKEACSRYGIYVCNNCNVTLHHECFHGKDMHLMPGGTFKYCEENVNIILNNRFTRNICMSCHNRCEEKIVYKICAREIILCSFGCLQYYC
ncbi:PREDICTED: uncharacterized protein LOC109129223 [Camelina sativa]|uniref:Uncharacterized protein LOC109129223 n=1 Tax=Camelina sativa TaxID=90675 RepID=A0ABM1R0H5_CAMSA|nr:PREDICTED: uncharacterized protein LOC109129223 [Camelina sativa]